MNILCSICARSGSKEIPNKNIKNLYGKPLISYTIEQAIKSKLFDKILISSDSEKIIQIALKYGAELYIKDLKIYLEIILLKLMIKNLHSKAEIFYNKKFDVIFDLDVTSPLKKFLILGYKLFR